MQTISATEILNFAKQAAAAESDAFDRAVIKAGYTDKWAAYRDEANWPDWLGATHDSMTDAIHAFYLMRDGENGILGGAV